MARLSLSKAWDESRAVLSRDGKLIGSVALALFFLPGVVAAVIEPKAEGVPQTGSELLVMGIAAIIGVIGQLAVIRLALGTPSTVGEAIRHGAGRAPGYIAASILWLAPFVIGFVLIGGDMLKAPEAVTPGAALGALVLLIALFFVSVRMLMSSSVASAERAGPIDILRRSWSLTRGHWWRLFGFLLVLLIVAMVSLGAAGAIVGIIGELLFDSFEAMTVGALFNAVFVELVTTIITAVFLVMLARIYTQLSGPDHADVSVPSSGT